MTQKEQLSHCEKCLNLEQCFPKGLTRNLTEEEKTVYQNKCPDFKLEETEDAEIDAVVDKLEGLMERYGFLKKFTERINTFFAGGVSKQEIVWKNLRETISNYDWSHIDEKENEYGKMQINANLEIDVDKFVKFRYLIDDKYLFCEAHIQADPCDATYWDTFVLANHFNLYNSAVVTIETYRQCVVLRQKIGLWDNIAVEVDAHYRFTKDVYSAFDRLIEKKEHLETICG